MSIWGDTNNSSSSQVPRRQEPERQDNDHMQPWFVADATPSKNLNQKAKTVTKQTMSILFPIIGLTIIILTLATVILFTVGLYE